MAKITFTVECELAAPIGNEEATDVWAWAVERNLETLELVTKATVIDFNEEEA